MSHVLTVAPHVDEPSVRALVPHLEAAWNRNDGAAYASVFTDDCDYIAFDGTHLRGREANAEHHARLFASVLHGSTLRYDNVVVRFLAPTVAVMHANGSVLMPWQTTVSPRRRSLQTYVVVNTGSAWRIAAFQNVRVRPLVVPRGFALKVLLGFFRLRTALEWLRRRRTPAIGKTTVTQYERGGLI